MSVPILNSGKIYVVTAPDGKHLGDYRTYEEALVRARAAGAIVDENEEPRSSYCTTSGGMITIWVELVDPLLR